MAASLGDIQWSRPMTYQFMAELVRSLGGRIREVRLDTLVAGAYAATYRPKGRTAPSWSMPGPATHSTSPS